MNVHLLSSSSSPPSCTQSFVHKRKDGQHPRAGVQTCHPSHALAARPSDLSTVCLRYRISFYLEAQLILREREPRIDGPLLEINIALSIEVSR